MAAPTQYTFELKEVAAALIKEGGIHEGLWAVGFEFTLGAGIFGTSPTEAKPGAFVQINKLQLTRHAEGAPEAANAVDAATINPARGGSSKNQDLQGRAGNRVPNSGGSPRSV